MLMMSIFQTHDKYFYQLNKFLYIIDKYLGNHKRFEMLKKFLEFVLKKILRKNVLFILLFLSLFLSLFL